MSVTPASYSTLAPKTAVFLSYALADEWSAFRIAGSITRSGATVFLDEACIRHDPESHVLNALGFADEVLILLTPTPPDYLKARRTPAFLDRRFVWLAVGVAFARGIPIRGLLKELTRREVFEDAAIPRCVRDIELFDTVELYELYLADLQKRTRNERVTPSRRFRLRCRICLCYGRNAHLPKLEKQLTDVGIESNKWHPESHVDNFDAAVVVLGDQSFEARKVEAMVSFLEDFLDRGKPVVLLSLPSAPEQPGVLDRFRRRVEYRRVEYRESENLSFFQLVWAIVGYRSYDTGTDMAIVEKPPTVKPKVVKPKPGEPLRVFISYSHKDGRLRRELETHLKLLQRQEVIAVWTDRRITAGQEWKDKIDDSLESADIILLLVSADFVASDYCYDLEMKRALKRHDAGEARIIPIILKAVGWQSAPFGKLLALPTDGKPVMLWTDRPSAWTDVEAGIRTVAEQMRSHRSGPSAGAGL